MLARSLTRSVAIATTAAGPARIPIVCQAHRMNATAVNTNDSQQTKVDSPLVQQPKHIPINVFLCSRPLKISGRKFKLVLEYNPVKDRHGVFLEDDRGYFRFALDEVNFLLSRFNEIDKSLKDENSSFNETFGDLTLTKVENGSLRIERSGLEPDHIQIHSSAIPNLSKSMKAVMIHLKKRIYIGRLTY